MSMSDVAPVGYAVVSKQEATEICDNYLEWREQIIAKRKEKFISDTMREKSYTKFFGLRKVTVPGMTLEEAENSWEKDLHSHFGYLLDMTNAEYYSDFDTDFYDKIRVLRQALENTTKEELFIAIEFLGWRSGRQSQ
jgi:5'-3' exonuclease